MRKHGAIIKKLAAAAVVLLLPLSGCAKESIFPHDGVVYSSQHYADGAVYFTWLKDAFFGNWPLACAYLDDPGEAYYACYDPLCEHSDNNCPAISYYAASTLVVKPEGRDDPLVFTFGSHGKFENNGLVSDEVNEGSLVVRVYDVMTGEGSVLAELYCYTVKNAYCLDGKIYLTADYYSKTAAGVLDLETGEYSEVDEDSPSSVTGIWNGRVYYITGRGKIKSGDLSLSDVREEYDCGDFTPTLNAFVDGGRLYYAVNDRKASDDAPISMSVCDMYSVDLDDTGAGAKLVATDVCRCKPYDGDLYYTLWDYKDLGKIELGGRIADVFSYDGGTLYRYDAENDESEVCFSDCGTSFYDIFDIADGKVIFYGHQYKNPETCKNTGTANYMCACDIETGEWDVIYHTTVAVDGVWTPWSWY